MDVTYRIRRLERIKYRIHRRIAQNALEYVDTDIFWDDFTDDLIINFKARLLSEPVYETEKVATLYVYSSWWQHFKDRYMPKWFKKKYPVRWTKKCSTVKFKVDAVYPKAHPSLGEQKVVVELVEGDWHEQIESIK